jgi:hypothetical protein
MGRRAVRGITRDGPLHSVAAWFPVGVGLVYAFALVLKYPSLVRRVYWDSDAAAFATGGQTLDRAGVFVLGHFASYSTLAFLLLTRSAPFHRQLWEGSQYGFALASFALLTWASWRLAGSWAAAMTATIGVAASPIVNYARIALDYHLAPGIAAAVLACFALWLAAGARGARLAVGALLVTIVAGTSLASDTLFLVVGLIPFVAAGAVFLFVVRSRFPAMVIIACSILSVPVAWATERTARGHVVVSPSAPLKLATVGELWPNAKRALGSVVQLANGNFTATTGWAHPTATGDYVLSVACAVLMVLALAAPFILLARELRAPSPSSSMLVWTTFWGACIAGNLAGAALTQAGAQVESVIYEFAVLEGVAATVPVLMARGRALRSIAGLGIGLVAIASLVHLLGPPPTAYSRFPALASVGPRIEAIASEEHAPYGYADYWDSSSLTWSSRTAVSVAPVLFCESGTLCPFPFNDVSTWYQPHAAGSFVLRDASSPWMAHPPPPALGAPKGVFRLSPEYTMYVYGYDVSSRFDDDLTVWRPELSYGGGFNAPEVFNGTTSRWMKQDATVRITSGIALRVSLSGTVFSNERPRTLELLDDAGHVLGKEQVPTFAVPFQFGPFTIPAGSVRLRLLATPGPEALGPTDPRSASVFIEPITMETTPAVVSSPRGP